MNGNSPDQYYLTGGVKSQRWVGWVTALAVKLRWGRICRTHHVCDVLQKIYIFFILWIKGDQVKNKDGLFLYCAATACVCPELCGRSDAEAAWPGAASRTALLEPLRHRRRWVRRPRELDPPREHLKSSRCMWSLLRPQTRVGSSCSGVCGDSSPSNRPTLWSERQTSGFGYDLIFFSCFSLGAASGLVVSRQQTWTSHVHEVHLPMRLFISENSVE